MQVYEAMTPHVVSVAPEATLMEAARAMKDLDIGPLPVTDGERLLGVVTDRDITVRATAEGLDPRETRVDAVMTPGAVCCRAADDVKEAASLMQREQLRRLLVIDDGGRLVGVVSLGDIAVQGQDDRLSGETLEQVSQPALPKE
jgi:CBS domain-containing protein